MIIGCVNTSAPPPVISPEHPPHPRPSLAKDNLSVLSGGSRISGRGGSNNYIHKRGVGTGGGVPPPVTARGGSGAKPQPLFNFSMKISIL